MCDKCQLKDGTMKKITLVCVMCAVFAFALGAQENKSGLQSILNHYAARNFTTGAVSKGDLDQILQAGIRAPSANNRQPWMFTVVQNNDLAKQIVSNIERDNVLIVISAEGDGQTNGGQILDCALAAQSIYLAAQALGYGSRLYTGPINTINQRLKTPLGLPAGHSAVVVVRVGKVAPGVDAQTAASSRASANAKVQYK
jgi:nitroreductase